MMDSDITGTTELSADDTSTKPDSKASLLKRLWIDDGNTFQRQVKE